MRYLVKKGKLWIEAMPQTTGICAEESRRTLGHVQGRQKVHGRTFKGIPWLALSLSQRRMDSKKHGDTMM